MSPSSSSDASSLHDALPPGALAIRGAGEMAALVRAHPWSATPLGPVDAWPTELLSLVNVILASPVPYIIYWGSDLTAIYNDGFRPFFSNKHPRSLGRPCREVWKEAWGQIGPEFERVLATGEAAEHDNFLIPVEKDGHLSEAWWKYAAGPIYQQDRVGGVLVACQEMTESFLAARDRDALATRLDQVLEATTDAIVSIDRNWRITYLNPRSQHVLAPSGDVIGASLWEAFPHTVYDNSPYVAFYHRAMDEGIAGEFEAFYPEPLNAWFTVSAQPAADGIVIFFRDVTLQRRAADLQRENQLKLQLATEAAELGIFTWYVAEDRVTWENERIYDIFLHDRQQGPINGAEFLAMVAHPDDAESFRRAVVDMRDRGQRFFFQGRFFRSDRTVGWIEFTGQLEHDPTGAPWKVLGTAVDITTRRQAEQGLRDSENRLKAIYDTTHEYVGLLTPEGVILDCNRASLGFAGITREEVIGVPFWQAPWFASTPGGPEKLRASIERAAGGESIRYEVALVRPNGEARTFDFALSPIFDADGKVKFLVPESRDITDLKRAEAALLQSEKLAAVGRLAASIAHEINNPLESVTNLLFLARHSTEWKELQEYLDVAERELRRVSIITNQTLRFHRQSTRSKTVGCEDLFENVLSVHQGRIVNSRIAVEKRKRAKRPVLCFDSEIRQVLSHLIGNAIDALHPCGGRLLVRSRDAHHWKTGREGLMLTVADTGSGMSPGVLKAIFEPFFTTKGIGGTGLGLWVSEEIVARHDGELRVRSRQGEGKSGTVFTLFLPHNTTST